MPGPNFISEQDVEKQKKQREADGKEEEPYDPRPLYDRLQAQKTKKQEEYEYSRAFKNQIHRIDEEEAKYLREVASEQFKQEKQSEKELKEVINEAKAAGLKRISEVGTTSPAQKKPEDELTKRPVPQTSLSSFNQRALLTGVIKRKSESTDSDSKVRRIEKNIEDQEVLDKSDSQSHDMSETNVPKTAESYTKSSLPDGRILIGQRPSLVTYGSDSSDSSSDTDLEHEVLTMKAIAIRPVGTRSHANVAE